MHGADTEPPLSSLSNLLTTYSNIGEQLKEIDEDVAAFYSPRAFQLIETMSESSEGLDAGTALHLEIEDDIAWEVKRLSRKANDASQSSSASTLRRSIKAKDGLTKNFERTLDRATALQRKITRAIQETQHHKESAKTYTEGHKKRAQSMRQRSQQETPLDTEASVPEQANSKKERVLADSTHSEQTLRAPQLRISLEKTEAASATTELLELYNHFTDGLEDLDGELENVYDREVSYLLSVARNKESSKIRLDIVSKAQEQINRVLERNEELRDQFEYATEGPTFKAAAASEQGNIDLLADSFGRVNRLAAVIYEKMAEAFETPREALSKSQRGRHAPKKIVADGRTDKLKAKQKELLKLCDRLRRQYPPNVNSHRKDVPEPMRGKGKARELRYPNAYRSSNSLASSSGTAKENEDRGPNLRDLFEQFDGKLTLNAADAWQSEAGSTRSARLERFRRNKATAEARLWDRVEGED